MKFSLTVYRTKSTMGYIHSDHWGPSKVVLNGNFCYLLIFIDDYSRKVLVFTLKHNDEVFLNFNQWKAMIEKQTSKKIKILITDIGLKFCSGEFDRFYKDEGIVSHRPVRHTLQQNVVVEHIDRILFREFIVCSLILDLERNFEQMQYLQLITW